MSERMLRAAVSVSSRSAGRPLDRLLHVREVAVPVADPERDGVERVDALVVVDAPLPQLPGHAQGAPGVEQDGTGRRDRPRASSGSAAARRTRERTRSERLMSSRSATSWARALSPGARRTKSLSGYRSTSLTPLRSRRRPSRTAPEGSGGSPAAQPARLRGAAAGGAPAGPGERQARCPEGRRGSAAGRCSGRCAHGTGYLLIQWLASLFGSRLQLSRRGCAARIMARRASSFMACSLARFLTMQNGHSRVGSACRQSIIETGRRRRASHQKLSLFVPWTRGLRYLVAPCSLFGRTVTRWAG